MVDECFSPLETRLPRWVSARWAWPCLLMADVRPSMNRPMASPVRMALDPSCWSWPVRLKRPRGAWGGRGAGVRWCDWGLGWASELLCQVFPWFHRGFSLTNSLHSWVLGQKKPNLFRKKCRTEIPSIASRQNGKQELAMALGVCVNQVPARKTWVCLKMGYIPNYSHLVGIMIINHWV